MNTTVEKLIYTAACVVAVVLSISSVALVALQGRQDARAALHTTTAVCGLRTYYKAQVAQSEDFLRLTPDERRAKYGSLADIPDSVIRDGLVRERQIVSSLAPLRCH
jgi:hypothetical protein